MIMSRSMTLGFNPPRILFSAWGMLVEVCTSKLFWLNFSAYISKRKLSSSTIKIFLFFASIYFSDISTELIMHYTTKTLQLLTFTAEIVHFCERNRTLDGFKHRIFFHHQHSFGTCHFINLAVGRALQYHVLHFLVYFEHFKNSDTASRAGR